MSASSSSTGSSSLPSCEASCWPSPSSRTASRKPLSNAERKPVCTEPPIPRLYGRRTTWAPFCSATAAVRSTDPSSMTTISRPGSKARISSITSAIASCSFSAGTIATRFSAVSRGSSVLGAASATSATDGLRNPDVEQLEQAPRAMDVRVLVQRALTRGAAHLLRTPGVVQQLPVGGGRLVRVRDDEQLAPRLEPALDPLVRVGDDRRAGHRELERTRRRGCVDGPVRAARHVEVDPGGGDRAREDVDRDAADEPGAADVAAKVLAAEGEIDLGKAPARLTDHQLRPLPAELVPEAVEED